ncbi:unnamed protein product [Rotaria socialis]|uniref:Heat shock factor binding protein n=1 Tax=Rotaria socialis TaxID=392032 RepID=A0A817Z755_9BILA|nr:unnamed protein product [Rotaria socialis]CAF3373258.1 unnamed protein product [Rotaria socialis]CAF3376074.1 unnamed protein product [Rotaria socialis]CAF3389835.1 unnamed protein product [Rotaria socialis]CAF3742754.1 unnamed protein product [Rotaria socialis]
MTNLKTTNTEFLPREPQNPQELADLVQNTMTQIQEKFGQMSDSIMKRIDDLGQQIDGLERNIAQVIANTNAEAS